MASVRFKNGRYYYRVTLYSNGKRKYIERGSFNSFEEAKKAGELAYPRKNKKVLYETTPHLASVIFERFPEKHPAHIPLKILYYTNCTIEEVYSIKATEIDFDNGIWSTTNNSYKLCSELIKLLKRHLHRMIESRIVFLYENKEMYLNIYMQDGRRIKKNQIYYIANVIRKTINPQWNIESFQNAGVLCTKYLKNT